MTHDYADADKYGDEAASRLVEACHSAIKERVCPCLAQCGGDWDELRLDKSLELVTWADCAAIDARMRDARTP